MTQKNFERIAKKENKAVTSYYKRLLQKRQLLLREISATTFLSSYAQLKMIEEKLQLINFGMVYPELFDYPASDSLVDYCEREYLRSFYDQRDLSLLNHQRSLFYTIWPDVPAKLIWETSWDLLVADNKEQLPLLRNYYQSLQKEGDRLLNSISPETFYSRLSDILVVDAKCNLLFWFINYSSIELPVREKEIVHMVEHDYQKTQEELFQSSSMLFNLDALSSEWVTIHKFK
ncbi:DUF7006 family protein [Enterococcus pallens]|uniref:Uncharacterized protein n=1 Tax=Enterococcus pallens ATCC BAA-351 TaxID=1158607 RepID=R2SLS4_9ENTE|nr:hypothetical protein [Enterococcus pallens]EOH93816.1 hypothetical protein UAU_02512 [Enterococcus pallens ATCC BAA-351]EOU24656.1 hypothetical protein I588_00643 [Enterococcus pallens ATCC BAA-351]OJG79522.1 hypothetical protein RV10_GL000649 [Enterococcus pallens]